MYVSDVAFGWNDDQLAVASPFTGVFYRPATGQPWQNATVILPKPLPAVSSIAFWNTELYVGSEGRSLLQTYHLPSTPIYTFFDFQSNSRVGTFGMQSITLRKSDGSGAANANIKVTTIASDGSMNSVTVVTDANGIISIISTLKAGDRVFLSFVGTDNLAAAETAFHF